MAVCIGGPSVSEDAGFAALNAQLLRGPTWAVGKRITDFATAAFASAAASIILKHWPAKIALVDVTSDVLRNDYNTDATFVSVAREVWQARVVRRSGRLHVRVLRSCSALRRTRGTRVRSSCGS